MKGRVKMQMSEWLRVQTILFKLFGGRLHKFWETYLVVMIWKEKITNTKLRR